MPGKAAWLGFAVVTLAAVGKYVHSSCKQPSTSTTAASSEVTDNAVTQAQQRNDSDEQPRRSTTGKEFVHTLLIFTNTAAAVAKYIHTRYKQTPPAASLEVTDNDASTQAQANSNNSTDPTTVEATTAPRHEDIIRAGKEGVRLAEETVWSAVRHAFGYMQSLVTLLKLRVAQQDSEIAHRDIEINRLRVENRRLQHLVWARAALN